MVCAYGAWGAGKLGILLAVGKGRWERERSRQESRAALRTPAVVDVGAAFEASTGAGKAGLGCARTRIGSCVSSNEGMAGGQRWWLFRGREAVVCWCSGAMLACGHHVCLEDTWVVHETGREKMQGSPLQAGTKRTCC
eukprot:274428-Chlamydomonas_euryale.AAC.3